jgi:hypothetical protein
VPPQETGNLFVMADGAGEILGRGIAALIPVTYRCSEPVVAGQIWATLTQKVGQTKVTDDADPIQSSSGALICDEATHVTSLFFRAPTGTFFEAGAAFLIVGLERYDGNGTLTAHDYRTVRLRK